jgi:glutathione S-transferase
MLTLFENAFSPFARKVRLVLDHKQLAYESVDGLRRDNRARLEAVNGRVEVPVLVHDDLAVVNSSDIIAYLERVFPERPIYPASPRAFVRARAWERCADTAIDPVLTNISYWAWAQRPDGMPDGLLEAARADLDPIYEALERELRDNDFVAGPISVADFALFPHLSAVRALDVSFDLRKCPRLLAWFKRMRSMEICARDLERTREYLASIADRDLERQKIFWRGDRVEWMLSHGFHEWFHREIEERRVIWPGLGVPSCDSRSR